MDLHGQRARDQPGGAPGCTAGVGQLKSARDRPTPGDGFRLERLGQRKLKNLDEAVEICRVLGPARATY